MPLPNQHYEVRFNVGADEADYGEVCESPIDAIVDMEYHKDGGLRKRHGWQAEGTIPTGMGAGSLVGNGENVAVLARNALLGASAGTLDPKTAQRRQDAVRMRSRLVTQISDGNPLALGDVAVQGDYACVVGTRVGATQVDVVVAIVDLTTGSVVARRTYANQAFARVVVGGGGAHFNVLVSNGTGVALKQFSTTDPTASPSSLGTVFTTNASSLFDVITDPADTTKMLAAYFAPSTSKLTIVRLSDSGSTTASFADAAMTTIGVLSLVRETSTNTVWVLSANAGGNGLYLSKYASDLSAATAHSTLDAGHTYKRVAIGFVAPDCVDTMAQRDGVEVRDEFFQVGGFGYVNHLFAQELCSFPFAVPASVYDTAFGRSRSYAALAPCGDVSGSAGTPALPSSYIAMLPGSSGDLAESTFADATVTKFQTSLVEPASMLLADADTLGSTGTYYALVPRVAGTGPWYVVRPVVVADDVAASDPRRPNLALFEVSLEDGIEPRATLAGTAYVGGGFLRDYDGHTFGEVVPLQPPLVPYGGTEVLAGSYPASGTLSYIAALEYTDALGNAHRSAPTTAYSYVHGSNGSLTVVVDIRVPTMRDYDTEDATLGAAGRWILKLFRAVGSTYYLVTSRGASTNGSYTLTDASSDATIQGHESLYTTGNVLQNEAPPACRALCAHRDRLWLISEQDPRSIRCSTTKSEAEAPRFNAALEVRLDDVAEGRALASMDDKLLVLTDSDTYAVVGDGPDATGSGTFAAPELVARGLGTSSPHGALVTPRGTFVSSPSGFKLLGRDLSVSDVGRKLLDTAPPGETARACAWFPYRQQAWFLLESSRAIVVFDLSADTIRWGEFTVKSAPGGLTIEDILAVEGVPYVLTSESDGSHLYRMDDTAYDDDGVFVAPLVRTGLIRPDGQLGDARYRVFHVFASRLGQSDLGVAVELQGSGIGDTNGDSPSQSYTISDAQLSGVDNPVHVRRRLGRQRGHGLRLELTQADSSAGSVPDSGGLILYGIGIEYGARGRAVKVGAASGG